MSSGGKNIEFPEIVVKNLPRFPVRIVPVILAVAAILYLAVSCVFTVQPEEEALILTFGKYTRSEEPGLGFKFPYPIQDVIKVPVERQLKLEFGFRTLEAGQRTRYDQRDYPQESLMLTGDLNVADVEWIVQYKIGNAYKWLFKVENVEETFRDMTEAVMRQIVGDHSVDEVITTGRTKIAADAKLLLQELCDRYETGIRIEQVVLQDVNPPQPVQASFNEVNESIQERERLINEAWAAYNKSVPRARGEAEQALRQAEGYQTERVNNAKGDAARFLALYEEYRKAPRVTRQRLYLETMERLLPGLGDKIVVDSSLQNMIPLLDLGGRTPLPGVRKGGE